MGNSELAHWIGLLGEGLNLAGAVVLAFDIFLRRKEHELAVSLSQLSADAREAELNSTFYRGIPVTSPDFPLLVLQRSATRWAYLGVGLLMAGFLCLAAYHAVEIKGSP
jgi:hypothetical protein